MATTLYREYFFEHPP